MVYFYPRPPRGGRQAFTQNCVPALEFLSTPSARRATGRLLQKATPTGHFYPRPPRGGRRRYLFHAGGQASISIHALREEGDVKKGTITEDDYISIHALREEGDASLSAMI